MAFGAAATNGLVLWGMLVLVLSLKSHLSNMIDALYTILILIACILVLVLVLRPYLIKSIDGASSENGMTSNNEFIVFWALLSTGCLLESIVF